MINPFRFPFLWYYFVRDSYADGLKERLGVILLFPVMCFILLVFLVKPIRKKIGGRWIYHWLPEVAGYYWFPLDPCEGPDEYNDVKRVEDWDCSGIMKYL